jgi:pyridoxamine 5'-phosphate oxidase
VIDLKNCIDFANENKLCYLATTEGDQPRVRILGFWYADESGFYLQTNGLKEMHKQLRTNPRVEICFYKHAAPMGTMLRLSGKVEFIYDIKLKEKVMTDRPFLKNFGLSAESKNLVIFRISHGNANFWTMENSLKPKEILEF